MSKRLLILFVKNPELGKVKTRLADEIGEQAALDIYELLLKRTKEVTKNLDVQKVVYFHDEIKPSSIWTSDYEKGIQIGADLGTKMGLAFQSGFKQKYDQICVIGSDCYDIKQSHIEDAFGALDYHDAVIGPAKDGGYYLLGVSQQQPAIFKNKNWSTDSVCSDTIADFERLNMKFHQLPVLSDVDVAADLGPWANEVLNKEIKR